MTKRKNRTKMIFIKFLKDNQKILKEFGRRGSKADKYNREPWMMRSNPRVDEDEEIIRQETESS